jgi:hypothetical protein
VLSCSVYANCAKYRLVLTNAHHGSQPLELSLQESLRGLCYQIEMSLMPAKRDGNRFSNPVPTKVGGLSLMFKIGPRFFFGGAARSPKYPLGPFHTDLGVYATSPASGLRITWLGHSSSFDLALHHWKQPIESVFAIQDLKLWSPTPGVPSEVVAGQEIRSEWWR